MIHPLLNPKSKHHYEDNGVSAIEKLEQTATVDEQIGWCKGNAFKYAFRQDKKGEATQDKEKEQTYLAYLFTLQELKSRGNVGNMIVSEAYRFFAINMEYTL